MQPQNKDTADIKTIRNKKSSYICETDKILQLSYKETGLQHSFLGIFSVKYAILKSL